MLRPEDPQSHDSLDVEIALLHPDDRRACYPGDAEAIGNVHAAQVSSLRIKDIPMRSANPIGERRPADGLRVYRGRRSHTLNPQRTVVAVSDSRYGGQRLGITDPLNLAGIVTSGDRVAALAANRVVYQDGVPLAVLEGKDFRQLSDDDDELSRDVQRAAVRRVIPRALRMYLGRTG